MLRLSVMFALNIRYILSIDKDQLLLFFCHNRSLVNITEEKVKLPTFIARYNPLWVRSKIYRLAKLREGFKKFFHFWIICSQLCTTLRNYIFSDRFKGQSYARKKNLHSSFQ